MTNVSGHPNPRVACQISGLAYREAGTAATLLDLGTSDLRRAGLSDPLREAEALLLRLLDISRIAFWMDRDRPVSPDQRESFLGWISRRARREPVQYITGEVTFFGLTLSVGPGVFIPRPETEFLVAAASAAKRATPQRILDLCTGSGAIAIALACQFQKAEVTAVDLSSTALDFARRNAKRHACDRRIRFLQGDLFAPLDRDGAPFDLIVANPPYVPDGASLPPEVAAYEPPEALTAGVAGVDVYRRIIEEIDPCLAPDGVLMLEMGEGQAAWLRQHLDGRYTVTGVFDFSGTERVVVCHRTDHHAQSGVVTRKFSISSAAGTGINPLVHELGRRVLESRVPAASDPSTTPIAC